MFPFILFSWFKSLFIQVTSWCTKVLFSFLYPCSKSSHGMGWSLAMSPMKPHRNNISWQGSWKVTQWPTPEHLVPYPRGLGICSGWLLVVSLLVRKVWGGDATEMPDVFTTFVQLFQIWALCMQHTSLNVNLSPLVSVASFLRAMTAINLCFFLEVVVMSPMFFIAHDFCFSTALSSSRFISYWKKRITFTSRGHLPPGQSQFFETDKFILIIHIHTHNTHITSVKK